MKKRRFSSYFLLALPYISILTIAMLSSFWIANQALSSYRTALVKEREKQLEYGFERFLKRANDLESFAYNMAQNGVVAEYVFDAWRQSEHTVIQRMKVQEELRDALTLNQATYVYLYDVTADSVIAKDLALSSAEIFYRFKYQIDGLTPQESIAHAREMSKGYNPVVEVALGGHGSAQMLQYKLNVPLNSYGTMKDQMFLVVASDQVFRDLEEAVGADGSFYVYGGSSGGLIYGSGGVYPEDDNAVLPADLAPVAKAGDTGVGKNLYGMECTSQSDMWRVRFYIDSSNWEWVDRNTMLRLLVGILLPSLIGFTFCVYFTYKNYREIRGIIEKVGSKESSAKDWQTDKELGDAADGETVSFKLVRKYVDGMVSENKRFQNDAAEAASSRKYEVLDRLLRHNYDNREDMERLLKSIEWKIRQENCVVICIRFKNADYRIEEMLEEITDRNIEVFHTSARETVCLLSIDETDDLRQVVEDIVSSIKAKILYGYDIEASFGVGRVASTIYEIGDAYLQAQEVACYNEDSEDQILLYDELERRENVFVYPPDTDDKILNYVATGCAAEAKGLIREIYQRNFENQKRALTENAAAAVLGKLWGAVFTVASKHQVTLPEEMLWKRAEGYPKCEEALCRCIDFLIAQHGYQKKNVRNQSASRIMDYVKQNYRDNGISVKQISLALGFNENYVSNLFKEAYGMNLSSFVEKLRMEEACALLGDPNIVIRDIAERVGYTSEPSFRRAFKKVYGVTPGEYRQGR